MENFAKFTENICDGCKLQTLLEKRHERKRFSANLAIFLEQVSTEHYKVTASVNISQMT